MNIKLLEAAQRGDVRLLHKLVEHDPLLLRAAALAGGDTPLHVACLGGHVDFVKQVLILRPEFALELNRDSFSPLHIATANGDIDIVKELLKLGRHLCVVKGKERRIPLHYAVANGRKQVIQELLSASLDSLIEVTARGESCCHLALKNGQFESFKLLVDHAIFNNKGEIFNMKDEGRNSILHLAASRKQYEVFELLLDENFAFKTTLDVNSLNKTGLTPLDVLISEGGDFEIEEMLKQAGASRVEEMHLSPQQTANSSPNSGAASRESLQRQIGEEHRRERPKRPSKRLEEYFKYDKIKESPPKVRNTLLVIAVLIATATYQAVLSPPGGVWQEDFWPGADNSTTTSDSSIKRPPPHMAGEAVMGTQNRVSYGLFLVFNSIGFFMSLHMINFLTLGLPLQFELRVSLCALTATYDTCMVAITPGGKISIFFTVFSAVMPLLMPVLTMVVRDYRKSQRSVRVDT